MENEKPVVSFSAEEIASRRRAWYEREEEAYDELRKAYNRAYQNKLSAYTPMKTKYSISSGAAIVILILCSSMFLHIIGTLQSWDVNALLEAGSKAITGMVDKVYYSDGPSLLGILLVVVVTGICWFINVLYTLILVLPCALWELLADIVPGGRTASCLIAAAAALLLFFLIAVNRQKGKDDDPVKKEKAEKKAEQELSGQKKEMEEQRRHMEEAKASLDSVLESEYYQNCMYH